MIDSLGYLQIKSDKLDDWAAFGPRLLGLQMIERTKTMLKFRMDDRKQRIVITSDDDTPAAFGWEVDSAPTLDEIAGRLEAVKVKVEPIRAWRLAMLGVTAGITFHDPAGNKLEAFHGAERASTPFLAGRPISGFRTGTLGLGHVVLQVPSVKDLQWFYMDVLGFRLSDYVLQPFKAYFFHVNARHHSFAIAENGKLGIHHVMMELLNLDDVGQAYDIAQDNPEVIATSMGRHANDYMTSFYSYSPNGFLVEYGWGGRSVDMDTWQPYEMKYGTSIWGHNRQGMTPEALQEARRLRAFAAQEGVRAPVQVSDGNYETRTSPCAWWESVKTEAKAG